jgi:hypothetical protein
VKIKPKLVDNLRNITVHLGIKMDNKEWLGLIGEVQIRYGIATNFE